MGHDEIPEGDAMPRRLRRGLREPVPDRVCALLFTGRAPSPYAVDLIERMLAATAGVVHLTSAELLAVERFVSVTEALSLVRDHTRDRGRVVVEDLVLDAGGDAVTLAVLWRSRRRRDEGRYRVQVARSVDGHLTMMRPTGPLSERAARDRLRRLIDAGEQRDGQA
jgi:hypothetical protein